MGPMDAAAGRTTPWLVYGRTGSVEPMPKHHPRRLVASFVAILVAMPLLVAAPASAAPTLAEQQAAEARVVQLINGRREQRDRRPFRRDPRVAAVARAKSQDMIDRHYFDHRDKQGLYADDHLRRAGIRFSRVGRSIAWGHGSDLSKAAAEAVSMWMSDAPHRREFVSGNNYVGAGIASDGRTWMATVEFITGPDRTKPVARMMSAAADSTDVRLSWTGYDPRLVVGTAGIRSYDLQGRVSGGSWTLLRHVTTERSWSGSADPGVTLEYRVRARDRAGNVGPWTSPVMVAVT